MKSAVNTQRSPKSWAFPTTSIQMAKAKTTTRPCNDSMRVLHRQRVSASWQEKPLSRSWLAMLSRVSRKTCVG